MNETERMHGRVMSSDDWGSYWGTDKLAESNGMERIK